MNLGSSGAAGHRVDPRWNAVSSATWQDFNNACLHVLQQLPDGHALLLQPALDGRVLRLRARMPLAQVLLRGDVIARPPARTVLDLMRVVDRSVRQHWQLDHPRHLSFAFEGATPRALALYFRRRRVSAPTNIGARRSKPPAQAVQRPAQSRLAERLNPDVIAKLREIGGQ